ncbi:MAG: YfhO family protein, partial [Oscillospiraceae bacterium]|nr:YfhO family protein [Oscillospiraceae bacterium]
IGWIVCIFCVIYFVYCFIADDEVVYEGVTASKEKEDNDASINIFAMLKNSYILGSMLKFMFASLLGGAMSAVLTLPTLFALQNTVKGTIVNNTFNPSEIWGFLASHVYPMEHIYGTLRSKDVLFCFAGLLSLLLCISYFFSKGISVRKKIGNFFLLAVMWASIIFHAVCFIWHGFGEPVGISYRFAFIYSFIIIKIAYEMFSESEKISCAGIILSLIFVGAGIFGLYKNSITKIYMWSAGAVLKIVAFALVYAVMLLIIKKKPNKKQVIALALTVLTAAEALALNFKSINKTDMTGIYVGREAVEELLENSGKEDFDTVSLTNKPNGHHEMMTYGLSYGYRSLELYSSMADGNFVLSAIDLGAYGNGMNAENGATETTPVFNLLFPTKYVIDGSGRLTENEFHKKLSEKDGYTLYENEFTMPFMYMLSGNIGLWRPFSFPVVADNINEVFKCITELEKDVALYNENGNFSFENCEHIATTEKVANQKEEEEQSEHEHEGHGHGEVNNDDFWNYLENKMADFAYRIDDLSKPAYVTYDSVAQCDGIMYIFVNTTEFTDMKITVNGKTVDYYTYGLDENRTYEIGEVKKGDVAKITIGGRRADSEKYVAKESSFAAIGFTVDMDIFREGYEKIDAMSDTEMLEFSDTHIKTKVNAYENGALYIPITFDKGWKITVDGVPAEIYEHESHIMMLPLSSGEHIIEMKYCPQGFVSGAAITGVSLLILIAWAVISKKRSANAEKGKEE